MRIVSRTCTCSLAVSAILPSSLCPPLHPPPQSSNARNTLKAVSLARASARAFCQKALCLSLSHSATEHCFFTMEVVSLAWGALICPASRAAGMAQGSGRQARAHFDFRPAQENRRNNAHVTWCRSKGGFYGGGSPSLAVPLPYLDAANDPIDGLRTQRLRLVSDRGACCRQGA